MQTVINFVESFKADLLHWRCPITFRWAARETRKKPIWRDALGVKHILGVTLFGNWLRQADKIPSMTCRAVKQMNKCVWDYLECFFVYLGVLWLWFLWVFWVLCMCVVLFVIWGGGFFLFGFGVFLMPFAINTWGNKPQRGYLGTVEQCKGFI